MTIKLHSDQAIAERTAFASTLARRTGMMVDDLRVAQGPCGLNVRQKGTQDFVTLADRQAEDLIRQALMERFPDDSFLGEESGGSVRSDGLWVVDPVDGTTNYLRGMAGWTVSIAFVANDRVSLGVIYDASSDRLYTAVDGGGAHVNEMRIPTLASSHPASSIVVLGMTFDADLQVYIDVISTLYQSGIDHRRYGASTVDLVHVSTGLVDGCLEMGIRSWDVLAGLLLARETGHIALAPPLSDFLKPLDRSCVVPPSWYH